MKCSSCNAEMKTKKMGSQELDECPSCAAIWFDAGEFDHVKDEMDPNLNWMDFDIWKHEDQFKFQAPAKNCPKCNINMATILYGNTDVEVNFCEKCRGIWLDKGEFEKIIEALNQELLGKEASDYAKAALEEAREIITGKEGLISEWKDFRTVLRLLKYRLFVEHPDFTAALAKAQAYTPFR